VNRIEREAASHQEVLSIRTRHRNARRSATVRNLQNQIRRRSRCHDARSRSGYCPLRRHTTLHVLRRNRNWRDDETPDKSQTES
jgi:hypothetical protein